MLSEIITAKHYNKTVSVQARVSGRTDSTYTVPSVLTLSCGPCKQYKCYAKKGTNMELSYPSYLKFVDVSERSFRSIIQSINNSNCANFQYLVKGTKSLLRIFLVDPINKDGKMFTAYFVGTNLEVNQMYEFTGTVVADPKTQNATAIFTEAKKVLSQIDSFAVTKESHDKLSAFCFDGDAEKTMRHLYKLYDSYAANVTHIYDRNDLHMAVDIVFHSPLSFDFDGEHFHKGWVDAAVIGDTRVGKGFIATALHQYFGVGEVISGDNATITGLIGGLKQIEKTWTVSWGAFPRNDGGMVTLDETSKLSTKIISQLTNLRSEGVAEIHRVASFKAPARVRTLFILNPGKPGHEKNISQYEFGIQSIQSVFKDPATVSRFDFVIVAAIEDAGEQEINRRRVSVPEIFNQDIERQLIYWIWSRKSEDIIFSEAAVDKIYLLSLDLAHTYSFDIPLIQKENIRYKLAKIATCIAGRLYSNKNNGKKLFVDAVHVECAWMFFTMIYKKKSSSYFAFSMLKKSLEKTQSADGLKNIDFYFQVIPN